MGWDVKGLSSFHFCYITSDPCHLSTLLTVVTYHHFWPLSLIVTSDRCHLSSILTVVTCRQFLPLSLVVNSYRCHLSSILTVVTCRHFWPLSLVITSDRCHLSSLLTVATCHFWPLSLVVSSYRCHLSSVLTVVTCRQFLPLSLVINSDHCHLSSLLTVVTCRHFWPLPLVTSDRCHLSLLTVVTYHPTIFVFTYFSFSEGPPSCAEWLPLPLNNHLLVTISVWPCLWALQAPPVVTIHLTTLVSEPPLSFILLGNFSPKNILCGSVLTTERCMICPRISECRSQHASVFVVGSLHCHGHSLLLSRPGVPPFNGPLLQIHIVVFNAL